MKKKDWKAARKRLKDADNADPPAVLQHEAFNRTLYHREYWRTRRSPMPKDKRCPLCRETFLERIHWRRFSSYWICRFCNSVMTSRREPWIRYLVDKGQLVNLLGHYPGKQLAIVARYCGIGPSTLRKMTNGELTEITTKTYLCIQKRHPYFRLTRNWVFHAPPYLARLRCRAGWTQVKAAEFVNLTHQEYWATELGQKTAPYGFFDELIKCLTLDADLNSKHIPPSQ